MSRSRTAHRPDPGERLAAAHAHLVSAVEQLTSGEEWRRMLEVAARFPSYSANNVLLIGIQAPEATRVGGIKFWNSVGRRVRKGEKGIAILAPCLYRPRQPDAHRVAAAAPVAADRVEHRPEPDRGEREPTRQLRGFRVVHVFAYEQTHGEPLPDLSPPELRGPAPDRLVERLTETLAADGYAVERGQCCGANGHTDFASRTVRVRDDVDEALAAKVLAHELGHIRADHETRFPAEYRSSIGCRAQAEVEAESIAFLISSSAGLPTDSYSVPYLAGWSGGNTDLLRGAAARVIDTARGVIRDVGLDQAEVCRPAPAATTTPVAARDAMWTGHDPPTR